MPKYITWKKVFRPNRLRYIKLSQSVFWIQNVNFKQQIPMKLFLLRIGIGLCISTYCIGQNLIPNAGFEYSWKCPNSFNQMLFATGWSNPTTGTPDYYNACGVNGFSLPKTGYGDKLSFEGKAYAALHGSKHGSEYIQIRLKVPLEKGQEYFCSIAISACEKFSIVSSDVGMLFTKEKIKRNNARRMVEYQPQIENASDSIFMDYEWHVVKGYFIAKGGEEYLTIGSFSKNVSKAQVRELGNHENPVWYNFIDNVSSKPVYRKKSKKKIQTKLNRLQNTTFENRSYVLDTLSFNELNKVLKILKRNKERSLKVVGHTDNNGSIKSNKTLSIQRCRAVKKYLVKHGIPSKRIQVEGKGDSQPLLPNTTDANRKKNRRVEFKVI